MVCLPPEARTAGVVGPEMAAEMAKYRWPVVQLRKALYGHSDSGTYWEQHCDKAVRKSGFVPLGAEWPSCYFHDELKLFLVIYVDDLKLSGPKESLAKGWDMLRKDLRLENPKNIDGESYLGCRNERSTMELPNGGVATTHGYNMEEFMRSCVELYEELVPGVRLKQVPTPFLADDHREILPHAAPQVPVLLRCARGASVPTPRTHT